MTVSSLQKILASNVDSGLSLFGHALSGGLDIDGNGYPGNITIKEK